MWVISWSSLRASHLVGEDCADDERQAERQRQNPRCHEYDRHRQPQPENEQHETNDGSQSFVLIQELPFSRLSRGSVYLPLGRESLHILLRLR